MCQSTIFLLKGNREEEILRDAILVEPVAEGVKVQGLFEAPRIIHATIKTIDLLKHRIVLEEKEG